MIACSKMQLPAAHQMAVRNRSRASIVASAARQPNFSDDAADAGVMRLLASRIAKLKRQQQAEQAKSMRPTLPMNVMMMDEVVADHRLICNWHENAWSQLRDTMKDKGYSLETVDN